MMQQIYSSDKPITLKKEDKFNRNKFASRIADTIIKRNNDDGLVIGLYGIWGEGKTSVLNMIENDLLGNDDILIVKFNPWRFKDEDTLILNFLKNITIVLDKELNSKKEKLGKFLKKWGSITSVIKLDLSKIGESLSDSSIEELKERVNDFLKETESKVVVIIDDIDRLDKQELFALFKLIKLTGDFSKTYYILSFDDEMVASSIGERYAEGNKNSGYNFLEKIIQVPLRIPKALSKDLLDYTLKLIDEILKENMIELSDNDASTIGYQISQNILLRIKTPRLGIRYSNSLSFLIPLLKGEVNIGDLILFEGIKLFYPNHYDFVKNSSAYFIESYQNRFSRERDNKKVEEFKEKIDALNQDLSKNEQKAILSLLKYLFPIIKEALENHSFGSHNWLKEKRIVSSKYFNRYFIYSVPNDDISDVYFENYIDTLSQKELSELQNETAEILKNIEPTEFLSKINFYNDELNWEKRKIIISLICKFQDEFEGMKGGSFMPGFYNPKSQAAISVANLISNNNYSESIEFAKQIIKSEADFIFSFELIRWFQTGKNENEITFNSEDIQSLKELLLERAVNVCNSECTNIFEKYPNYIFRLLEYWYDKSPQELYNYIDELINKQNEFQEVIIDSLTSIIYSSLSPEPYKVDFTKDAYDVLKKSYDVSKLYQIFSEEKYISITEQEAIFFDTDKGQTKENAIRQFIYWYEKDNIPIKEIGDTKVIE